MENLPEDPIKEEKGPENSCSLSETSEEVSERILHEIATTGNLNLDCKDHQNVRRRPRFYYKCEECDQEGNESSVMF